MFSVYGSAGRLFRGSLEQMRQVRPVHAVDRTRSIEPVVHDGRDSALREAVEAEPRSRGEVQRNPLAAYAPVLQPAGQRWGATPVGAVMSSQVVTVADTATLVQAWRQLELHGVGQAPVVNGASTLVGLLTRAGLAVFGLLPGRHVDPQGWQALLEKTVASAMVTPVPSVAADTDLRRVAILLLESRLAGLSVVDDDGLVVGFVSWSDILRRALDDSALDLWG